MDIRYRQATFNLEYAEGFPALKHLVDRIIILGFYVLEFVTLPFVISDQIQTFPDAGQHAQRKHINLHHLHRVDIVLVPFDEGAVVHRRIADRHIGVEPVLRQHIAADMLR
jgi:hypothetical protein